LLLEEGGCAIKIRSRSILSSRRRGGVQTQQNSVEFDHHPVRSIKEASRYFIDVASTPPRRGGENRGPLRWATAPSAPFAFGTLCPEAAAERGLKPATTLLIRRLPEIHENDSSYLKASLDFRSSSVLIAVPKSFSKKPSFTRRSTVPLSATLR